MSLVIKNYDETDRKYPIDPETGDYYYDEFGDPIADPLIMINDNYWQTILYYNYVDEQLFLDGYGLEVTFPINGSWVNTYYQFLRNQADGYIVENGYIILSSEPTWSGTAEIYARPYSIIYSDFTTDGDGINASIIIRFGGGEIVDFSVEGGSGYKVGDIITIPSLTDTRVTGDIVFTVLEVVEY
jgi:hypothetical protein